MVRRRRLKRRGWLIASGSVPVLASAMDWLWSPSISPLQPLDVFAMWCVVAAAIVVNIALMASLPDAKRPLLRGGSAVGARHEAAPQEKRLRISLYVSVPILAVALNRLYEPSTFGTFGGLFQWLVAAAVLTATGLLFTMVVIHLFGRAG